LLPSGLRHYWKTHMARDLPDKAVDLHIEHGSRVPTAESGAFFFPLDAAVQRVPADATAFIHRDTRFAVAITGTWHDASDDERNTAWVRDYYEALRPYAQEGGYVNFLAAEEKDRVPASYGGNYERLVEVKRRYDPTNLFRINQNVTATP
jgi:FAD/FMN-containing dehydrogenase